MPTAQLSICFFLQMACILFACRVVGFAARRIGQPQVVGEMIAGVVLGPSLIGLLAPTVQTALFPPESLGVLHVGAQLGVGLYMFLVGLEFDHNLFSSRTRWVAGKAGACYLAARLTGADSRTAAAVGVLMNARGLMELIILDIGLRVGVIEPRLFSVMVFMAIVTTLMATPAFEWVYGRHAARDAVRSPADPVAGG